MKYHTQHRHLYLTRSAISPLHSGKAASQSSSHRLRCKARCCRSVFTVMLCAAPALLMLSWRMFVRNAQTTWKESKQVQTANWMCSKSVPLLSEFFMSLCHFQSSASTLVHSHKTGLINMKSQRQFGQSFWPAFF